MNNKYIQTPESISFETISEKEFTLSSSQYMDLILPNKNYKFVGDFLSRPLKRVDLGNEIGSINYIKESPFYFLRTKALQELSFLPEITSESALPVMPNAFVNQNLKEGDILISKDSNIGEVVILDKDYPNYMTSSAIYKLPVDKNKYYLLAFIKHQIFREQLDFMVPKGATIRHAKQMFLDCKIPLPNKNKSKTIELVEVLTKSIIKKEKLIKEHHSRIIELIEKELANNQKSADFKFELPHIDEIMQNNRLDTSRYSMEYKHYEYLIQNYKNGFFKLSELGYYINRGQNLQVSNIGESYYSSEDINGFYKLAVSSNFSEYSTVEKMKYLGNPKKLKTINKGEVIFSARGVQFGRVIIFPEDIDNTITNIDSLVIKNTENNLERNIFIAMFLNHLRWNKHIYKIAITGSGANSLTQYQSNDINFPNFPESKQKEISKYYYNSIVFNPSFTSISDFLEEDEKFNQVAGIYELNKGTKRIRKELNNIIDNIVNDTVINIE